MIMRIYNKKFRFYNKSSLGNKNFKNSNHLLFSNETEILDELINLVEMKIFEIEQKFSKNVQNIIKKIENFDFNKSKKFSKNKNLEFTKFHRNDVNSTPFPNKIVEKKQVFTNTSIINTYKANDYNCINDASNLNKKFKGNVKNKVKMFEQPITLYSCAKNLIDFERSYDYKEARTYYEVNNIIIRPYPYE